MLQNDIIKASHSAWSSPVVLVKKKDGSSRFCVDFRKLNDITEKDAFPLPRIDDVLESLAGAKFFSTLDLACGYYQVELDPETNAKSAFATSSGLYEFTVLPFGLCNAPASFSRLIQNTLSGELTKFTNSYLDDILVFSKESKDNHISQLREVFLRLRSSNLKIKPEKCRLFRKRVKFVGHEITTEEISADSEKIQAVRDWPAPGNVAQLRTFLGFSAYYRKFVKNFAQLADPLYRLTSKGVIFKWTPDCEDAFQRLKNALITGPVLAYPDFDEPFLLDTDASDVGIGSVLSQVKNGIEHVISYGSRSLTKSERRYATTRKELLAVVYFVNHFRHYLLGNKFMLRTDHSSLQWLRNMKDPEGQLARWLESLQEFNFDIQHRSGTQHSNADGLSRLPQGETSEEERGHIVAVSEKQAEKNESGTELITNWSWEDLKHAQHEDLQLAPSLRVLENNHPDEEDYKNHNEYKYKNQLSLQKGCLFRKSGESMVPVIPRAWVRRVLQSVHCDPGGGHLGVKKTLCKVKERFFWVNLNSDVKSWCRSCVECASRKTPLHKPKAPLQTVNANYPFERIAIDIVGPLPISNDGNRYILVASDYFTKWVEAYPLPNQEAETIACVLVEQFFCRFGIPVSLHSDQGRNFESNIFQEMCKILGIKKTRTTPYHPASDGLVERFNRTLIDMLSISMSESQDDWDHKLPIVLMAYRSSRQESTGFTPHTLVTGREMRLPCDHLLPDLKTENNEFTDYAAVLKMRLEEAFSKANESSAHASEQQKRWYDAKTYHRSYKIGDLVWLHCPAVPKGKSPKFHRPWKGPFKVQKILSPVNLRISKGRKRIVVHHNRLKPAYMFVEKEPVEPGPVVIVPQENTNEQNHDGNISTEQLPKGQENIELNLRRPVRMRRPPSHLRDFETEF